MFLFPVDGILEVVLSYGQMISLFLVFVIFEGMIAAKSETAKPGLVFIFLVFLLAVFVGVMFHDISFFVFMLIPVAKGIKYNKDGLIEEELKKMEKN